MKKSIIAALAMLVTLAGCTKEGFEKKEESSLKIGTVSTERMLTKAVIEGTAFSGTDATTGIGLFLTASDGSAYDGKSSGYSNIKYSNSGSGWTSASPIMLSGTEGKLYAYFPYSSSATDVTAIQVSSSLNGTDYMYAELVTGVSKSKASVDISMKHALARISVKFIKDASYTGAGALSAFTLSGSGISTAGNLDARTGAITATAGAFSQTGLSHTITTGGLVEECLIVPVLTTGDRQTATLACTVDGKDYSVTFDGNNGMIVQQGIQFNVILTVKDSGLSVTGVGVGAWGGSDSSAVELDNGKTVKVGLASNTPASDVMVGVRLNDAKDSVYIKAFSESGKWLKCDCTPSGSSKCTSSKNEATGVYSFAISDVTEDIEATVGYIACNVSVGYASGSTSAMGKYTIDGAETSSVTVFAGESVKLKAIPNTGYMFKKWVDNNGIDINEDNPFVLNVGKDSSILLVMSLGTANCYAIKPNSSISFVAVKGNAFESVGTINSASVLWESFGTDVAPNVGDVIKTVSFDENTMFVSAGNAEGNAVVVAKDNNGVILWSWHIWVTNIADGNGSILSTTHGQTYNNNAGKMMDRNLGALSVIHGDVQSLGLMYQWGRKDPFLGRNVAKYGSAFTGQAASTLSSWTEVESNSFTGTIDYSIQNPATFILQNDKNNDWYYTGDTSIERNRWNKEKSIYDPCPVGWHIPEGGYNGVWAKAFAMDELFDASSGWELENMGINFGQTDPKLGNGDIWYPGAGYKKNGSKIHGGGAGFYWSCTIGFEVSYCLLFGSNGTACDGNSSVYPYEGLSVRCVAE